MKSSPIRGGALAKEVAALIDGGYRLSIADVERLGTGMTRDGEPPPDAPPSGGAADMVDRALTQLDDFAATVRSVHAETNDFGRDLAASAEAIRDAGPAAGLDTITRITDAMLERVTLAETRLESARRESDELRLALAEAHGTARTDPLTGLPNRRSFDELFADLPADENVTIAICDIDLFKRVNDSFGHEVGDRVLQVVARTMAGVTGATATRYGGEEFALLFRDIDIVTAARALDDARATLIARRLRVRETGQAIGTVTFSAGLASGVAGQGRAALMRRADGALYRAKDGGRARSEIAP